MTSKILWYLFCPTQRSDQFLCKVANRQADKCQV